MGKKLRALRKDAGLTLAQLSAKSGLSVGYLSQIERDISHPSIRSLTDLATIFDVSMGWLFDTPDPERSDEGKYIVRRENRGIMNLTPGIREEVLSPNLEGPLKLFTTVLQPGAKSGDEPLTHRGSEAGLVMHGELTLYLADEKYHLREGDSFNFSSSVSHRFANEGNEPVEIVWSIAVG